MSARIRMHARDFLDLQLSNIREGRGDGALLIGPVGIGKSHTLLRVFRALEREPGVLAGFCRFESLEEPPLTPVLAALGQALAAWLERHQLGPMEILGQQPRSGRGLESAILYSALAVGGRELLGRELEPALHDVILQSTEACREDSARWLSALHSALRQLQVVFDPHGPLPRIVLVFDQLELAGRLNREVVNALLEIPPSQLSILVGLNESSNPSGLRIPQAVNALPRYELEPLRAAELHEIYKHYAGDEGGRRDAARVVQDTSGNPLACMMLATADRLRQPFDAERPFAAAHLRVGVETLDPFTRQLLALLSLLPFPLGEGWLEPGGVLAAEPHLVERSVELLKEQGFLEWFPQKLSFAHQRMREVVVETVGDRERSSLGGRLARYVESRHAAAMKSGAVLPAMAVWTAGQRWNGDVKASVRGACLLGEAWMRHHEWEQARLHLSYVGQHLEPLELGEQARFQNLWGVLAFHQSRWDEASEAFTRATTQAAIAGNEEDIAHFRLNATCCALARYDLRSARAGLREWLDNRLRSLPRGLVAHAWYHLGIVETQSGDAASARRAFKRALHHAASSESQSDSLRIQLEVAEILFVQGEREAGLGWLGEALDHQKRLNAVPNISRILDRMATVNELTGQLSQAEGCWLEALAGLQSDGQTEGLWCTIANNFGGFLHRVGRYDDASRILLRALDVARSSGHIVHEARVLNNLAMLYETLGSLVIALEHAQSSVALKQRIGEPRALAVGLNNLGTLYFSLRRLDEARDALDESLRCWKGLDEPISEAITLNNLAMVYERCGVEEQALRCYSASLALKKRLNDPMSLRHTLTNMVIFFGDGLRWQRAEQCMKSIVDLDREMAHSELALTEQYLARMSERVKEQRLLET